MTIVKENEIKLVIQLGKYLAKIKEYAYDLIDVGSNALEVARLIEAKISEYGKPTFKNYQGFPEAVCISVNQVLIHGIPKAEIIFKEGDLVKVDLGLTYAGFCGDTAFSKSLGENRLNKMLIKTAFNSLKAGLKKILPGVRVSKVEREIGRSIKKANFFTTNLYSGHGIGVKLHEDPAIFNDNFYPQQKKIFFKEGQLICIEPMILQTNRGTKVLADG